MTFVFNAGNQKAFTEAVLTGGKSDETNRHQGMKYSHYGSSSREGVASQLDGAIIERRMRLEQENYGAGFVSMTVDDKTKPLNIGGRLFYPDAQGRITIVDGAILDKELHQEMERRAYIDKIIERASISNPICSMILGVDCDTVLGRGNGGKFIKDVALVAIDANPETIETYDPSSVIYSQAISKFKQIIKAKMPIIQDLTTDKVAHEGAEAVK
jgi:hypothetical protein